MQQMIWITDSSNSSKEHSPLPILLGHNEQVWEMKDSIERRNERTIVQRIDPPNNKNANGKKKDGQRCALMWCGSSIFLLLKWLIDSLLNLFPFLLE